MAHPNVESLEFDRLYIRRERGVREGLESLVAHTLGEVASSNVRAVLRNISHTGWRHASSEVLRDLLSDGARLGNFPGSITTFYALGTLYTDRDRDYFFLGLTRFSGQWMYRDVWYEGVFSPHDAVLVYR